MPRGRIQTTFGRRFYPSPIEREAEKCITACMKAQSLATLPLPVPVEQWLEGPLRVDFGIEELSHLGSNVLGASFVADRAIRISPRLLNNEGRYRFTCAHELGHLVLHAKLQMAFRDDDIEAGKGRDLHELEADRFAAAFLMPADVAVQVILHLARQRGIDPLVVRSMILSGDVSVRAELQQSLVAALVSQFTVSRSAAEFRLRELLQPPVGPFMSAVCPPAFLVGR